MESKNEPVILRSDTGEEQKFEHLETIFFEDNAYVALLRIYDDPGESLQNDSNLFILKVVNFEGEEVLEPIYDDDELDRVVTEFESLLDDDEYEIEVE